MEMIYVRR